MAARFHSIEDPKVGTAELYFFRNEQDFEPAAIFKLTGGRPWHLSGQKQFHWDYLEPSGERNYGIIMLAVSRTARIEEVKTPPPIPSRKEILIIVQVYRLQNDNLLPQPNEKINFQRIAGQPVRWLQYQDPYDPPEVESSHSPTLEHATIQPYPRGVQIDHDYGEWNVGISAPANEPAAFAYDLSRPQIPDSFTIYVVRSSNVKISGGRVTRSGPLQIQANHVVALPPKLPRPPVVQVAEFVTHLRNVPPQGTPLEPSKYSFREWTDFDQWLSPSAKRTAIIVEIAIGFIPYVGAIYDVAQLAYAATTGKNFWGETMHETDYLVLGVVAVLPVAFAARQLKPALSNLKKSNRLFEAALEESTTLRISERIDHDFLAALKEVPVKQQEQVVESVEGLAKGTASAKQVLKEFDDAVRTVFEDVAKRSEVVETFERNADRLVDDATFKDAIRDLGELESEFYGSYRLYKTGKAPLEEVTKFFNENIARTINRFKDEQRLLTVFTDDFSHFRVEPFASRYTKYLQEGKTLSAVQWAKSQSVGRFRKALEAALGKDYTTLINKTLGEKFIYEVSEAQRQAFFRIVENPRLQTYSELREAAKKAGIGKLFEVDHIFEKRFLKSGQVVGSNAPDEADFFAILVPRNPAVARQMPELIGGYTHSVKTQMLRDLIPHGKEDLFTVQQWWDAHVFVLKKVRR